jgi:hypothetical protein
MSDLEKAAKLEEEKLEGEVSKVSVVSFDRHYPLQHLYRWWFSRALDRDCQPLKRVANSRHALTHTPSPHARF